MIFFISTTYFKLLCDLCDTFAAYVSEQIYQSVGTQRMYLYPTQILYNLNIELLCLQLHSS